MTTASEREVIFVANCATASQLTPAATAYARDCREALIGCADCTTLTMAKDLDTSTGLCGTCYQAAGDYNDYQDGRITKAELADAQAELGYTGEDLIRGAA